jgi:2-amino-4-hydroxy-6-hydroxymethyldihydropteridine diphosphokinase
LKPAAPAMRSASQHKAFLSIGSNMGDKLAHCRFAIASLGTLQGAAVSGLSPFYRTAPVDYTDQDWFINAAVRLATVLDPLALLRAIRGIENAAGRVRGPIRGGPRTLDIDLLFYDDAIIHLPELEVPHPRLHERRFVLQPVCDIEPEFIHPVRGCTVQSLLAQLDTEAQEVFPLDD